jgi:hypothetical protein
MRLNRILTTIRKDPRIHQLSLATGVLYGLIYYGSAGFISFGHKVNFNLILAPNIRGLIWQSRGPFQWEAIAKLEFLWTDILISIPNLLIATLLMGLVYANLAVVLIGLRHPKVCRLSKSRQGKKVMALIPALFTGFSCCAPTILILWVSIFGSVSSMMVLAIRWLLPLGLVLLTLTLLTGYRHVLVDVS